MERLDELPAALADGRGLLAVLVLAFALGLRHAADPDHLVAVSTLVASKRAGGARSAALLGGAWGAGHGVTLLAFGLPVVLFQALLPDAVQRAAEALVGAIIVVLGLRLLLAWRRGAFHVHAHEHGAVAHVHVHSHRDDVAHAHAHAIRGPGQSFTLGLVHGLAGSAGVTLLLLASLPRGEAGAALAVLALGTAASMTILTAGLGSLLGSPRARGTLARTVPVLGSAAVLFGTWYAAAAVAL